MSNANCLPPPSPFHFKNHHEVVNVCVGVGVGVEGVACYYPYFHFLGGPCVEEIAPKLSIDLYHIQAEVYLIPGYEKRAFKAIYSVNKIGRVRGDYIY